MTSVRSQRLLFHLLHQFLLAPRSPQVASHCPVCPAWSSMFPHSLFYSQSYGPHGWLLLHHKGLCSALGPLHRPVCLPGIPSPPIFIATPSPPADLCSILPVCVPVCTCLCLNTCTEARGQCLVSPSISRHLVCLFTLRHGRSLA